MTSPSAQRRMFDAAIECYRVGDHGAALVQFTAITEASPEMSDAWLGRMASGDRDLATLEGLHANPRALYRETRRLGLPDGTLYALVDSPLHLKMPVWSRSGAGVGLACGLIAAGRFDEAVDVLAEQSVADDPAAAQWRQYVMAALYYTTGRWPDVLTVVRELAPGPGTRPDPDVTAALAAIHGSAQACLGDFAGALSTLANVACTIESVMATASLTRGLCLRATGDEPAAAAAFRAAVVGGRLLDPAREALDDPAVGVIVTDAETIDTRTERWDPATETSKAQRAAEAIEASRAEALEKAEAELASLIGLEDAKEQIEVWRTEIQIDQLLAEDGSAPRSSENHIVLQGPPGTAKTTFARIAVHILYGLGMIERDNIEEVSEEDVVVGFVSQTSGKMRDVLESALDGALFIDEAYRLVPETEGHSFGKDAINTLLKFMEDHRDRLVVIVAGYRNEMKRFMAANPGLASRFHFTLEFESYTAEEVVAIGRHLAAKESIDVIEDAWALLQAEAQRLRGLPAPNIGSGLSGLDEAGNGRYARKVVLALRRERARRLHGLTPAQLTELARSDRGQLTVTVDDMRRALATSVGDDLRRPAPIGPAASSVSPGTPQWSEHAENG